MTTKEHIINVDGVEIIIHDLDTSETMVHMKEQVYEQDEYKLKNIDFKPGDVVIDIGANVGCVSVFLAKKFPYLKIYSYEAHPVNYKNLLKNIEINKIENIVPNNFIVLDKDDDGVDIELNRHNSGSTSIFKTNSKSPESFNVKTISLDTIIEKNNINDIKFLKLDCEGSEFRILNNSKKIHNISIENIAVEIHTFVNNESVDDLINLINKTSKNKPITKVYTLG